MFRTCLVVLLTAIVIVGCGGSSVAYNPYAGTWIDTNYEGHLIVGPTGSVSLFSHDLGDVGGADLMIGSVSNVGAVNGSVTNQRKPNWKESMSGTFVLNNGILTVSAAGATTKMTGYFNQ